jgi:hypothetical protein
VRLRFEWRLSDEELVAEDSERPEVDFFVVETSLNHLWRQVVQSAAPTNKIEINDLERTLKDWNLEKQFTMNT